VTDQTTNVIGAMTIALGDRLREATEEAAGMPASFPPALAALRMWAGGQPVDVLADGLRVSHSRAVRVVDRLEEDGLARRRASRDDGRVVLVELTAAGRRAADRVLDARADALEESLRLMTPDQRRQFGELASLVLSAAATGRRSARGICRLCDAVACGHYEGRCPVTHAADAAERA
jgi:DNA-binding MarR family transcriptional regulator